VLARFKPDGSLDSTFGIGGIATTNFGRRDRVIAIAIQPDGKILAAGSVANSNSDFVLARNNPDGSLDTTFGIGGRVTTDFYGVDEFLRALAIRSDGKIVAAGHANGDMVLARYNSDGSLDSGFGIDGKVVTDLSGTDRANALAIQTDGKIIAAGATTIPVAPTPPPYVQYLNVRGILIRYNEDGSLDTTFGDRGRVMTDIMGTSEVNTLSIQSDRKIIAAGRSVSLVSLDVFRGLGPTLTDFGLVRYNENGSLDTSFGAQGRVTTDLNVTTDRNASYDDIIHAVSLQPDGKIIAAGDSQWDGVGLFGLARYNRDGSLDTTFGIGGKVRMNFPARQFAHARSLGIQPDGRIVVAGGGLTVDEWYEPVSTSIEFHRFNTTGLQIVSAIHFDAAIIRVGGSWNAIFSGSNLKDGTWFDVRFRSPGSTTDQVALNWQQGTSARHTVPAGTEAGTWIVTGIRAHESVNDHGGEFVPVSAILTVTGGPF
jgi:uncharacterized delta-60 repeat protein